MKLTFIIPKFSGGGAERVASILTGAWAERGMSVTVLTFESTTSDTQKYKIHPAVEYLPMDLEHPSTGLLSGMRNNLRRILVLRHMIRQTSPDVIVSFIHRMNILTLISSRGLGIPVIVSERIAPSVAPIGYFWELLRKRFYPMASAVVMQYESMKDAFDPKIRALAVTIPNPILNMELTAEAGKTLPENTVIAVGRLEQHKRFDLLISAFAKSHVNFPQWHLTILGDGKLRRNLEIQAAELGVEKVVEFKGYIANPVDFLRSASFYVQSSQLEGFPNALCEAMAAGLPVVATDCPGAIRDIIREGIDGVIVPNKNEAALSEAMQRLMADADLRRKMGLRAKEIVSRFDIESVLSKWNDLFRTLGVC